MKSPDHIRPVVRWAEFADAAPTIAERGHELLYRSGEGAGLLATVRDGELPRIHPVNVGVVGDGLYTFLLDSPKRRDLDLDGRYALHAHQDPAAPSEFALRGRATRVNDTRDREHVAAHWFFEVDQSYTLFELLIGAALLGDRSTADDWPPRYATWRPGGD